MIGDYLTHMDLGELEQERDEYFKKQLVLKKTATEKGAPVDAD